MICYSELKSRNKRLQTQSQGGKANISLNILSALSALGNMIECERFHRKITISFIKFKVLELVTKDSIPIPNLSIMADKNLTIFGSASLPWFDSKSKRFQKIVVMHISLSDASSSSCFKNLNCVTRIRLTVWVLQTQGNHSPWRAVKNKEMLTTQVEKTNKKKQTNTGNKNLWPRNPEFVVVGVNWGSKVRMITISGLSPMRTGRAIMTFL